MNREILTPLYVFVGLIGMIATLLYPGFYPPNPINPIFFSAFLVFGLHLYGVKKMITYGMFLLLLSLSLGIEFYYLLNAQLKNAVLFLITPLFVGVKFAIVFITLAVLPFNFKLIFLPFKAPFFDAPYEWSSPSPFCKEFFKLHAFHLKI